MAEERRKLFFCDPGRPRTAPRKDLHINESLYRDLPVLHRLDPKVMTIDEAHPHERLRFRCCDVDDDMLVVPDQGRLIEIEDLDCTVSDESLSLSNQLQAESIDYRYR